MKSRQCSAQHCRLSSSWRRIRLVVLVLTSQNDSPSDWMEPCDNSGSYPRSRVGDSGSIPSSSNGRNRLTTASAIHGRTRTIAAAAMPSRPPACNGKSTKPRKLFENSWPPMTTFQRIANTCTRISSPDTPLRNDMTRGFKRGRVAINSRKNGTTDPGSTWTSPYDTASRVVSNSLITRHSSPAS